KPIREANKFSWGPILEVAFLFFGIFITMIPALEYLKTNAHDLGINSNAQYYYATGSLSAFLDNTPTALAFHQLALGMNDGSVVEGVRYVAGIDEMILTAICLGAVLFGA